MLKLSCSAGARNMIPCAGTFSKKPFRWAASQLVSIQIDLLKKTFASLSLAARRFHASSVHILKLLELHNSAQCVTFQSSEATFECSFMAAPELQKQCEVLRKEKQLSGRSSHLATINKGVLTILGCFLARHCLNNPFGPFRKLRKLLAFSR